GEGITPFKRASEYLVCLILLTAAGVLVARRQDFPRDFFAWFLAAILITILSDLAFTAYIGVYGSANLVGHLLKIVAVYLLYRAFIEAGLTKPYSLLFRDLKKSE